MAKKKDAFTGSADASVLRRSGREIPSRKQTTSSPINSRRSPRVEKHTSPSPSPVKSKLERIETQTESSSLRRSDRGKKLAEIADSPNMKSTKEKTPNNSKQSSEDITKDKKTEMRDSDVGGRKRKKIDAISYKALFKYQRIRADTDADKVPKSQNGRRVQVAPDKGHKAFLEGRVIDLGPIEHGDFPRTKSLDGKSIESGDVEKQNGGNLAPSNGNTANSGNLSHTSSHRIEHDLENQQELDTCHKVTETCKAAGNMEDAENNDVISNMQNSKFVEFWVPLQLSNVQLEQYCATLLSNATTLRSSSKNDTLGALENIFITNRKCCNHPYTVDLKVEQSLIKDKDPSMVVDVGAQASAKLQFLDYILPEIQKQKLKVLILFQPTSGVSSGNTSLGNLLVEFVIRRFGQNSYELVDGLPNISSKKLAAINMFNEDLNKFIFLLESRACHQSIKLSSVDAIIIFDSELNPSNDLKSLQKLSIDSHLEQIMIFRLYSLSTLEEKILKLAESNVALDIKSQKFKISYDALLKWGASDLFDKLTEFHSQTGQNVSCEESFLKDVVEEFLYILSHKCKRNDTASKSIITRVQNYGVYGKNTSLHNEVNTHLPDGDQPCIFWKKLLEGRCPVWKFVSESTPRQRKRPSNFLEGKSGGVKTHRKTVNNSTIEPVHLKTVTEGENGGLNEGDSAAANESQSSSVDWFWSTEVNDEVNDEQSLLNFLKPTVSELCNILKLSEDTKITVEEFLEYVLKNHKVSKKPTGTLQAFVISLCWVGSSLAKSTIDRIESFAVAKKHFDFTCEEQHAEVVYKKLLQIKENFLRCTHITGLKDIVSAPEGDKLGADQSQHVTNVDVSDENVTEKGLEEFEKVNREWDEKRASLENDLKVEQAVIKALYWSNPSRRSEKLKEKEREFANKFKEHDSQKQLWEATIQHETQALQSGNAEVAITLPEYTADTLRHDEPVCEGANDIESTGSHTSEKEIVDATVSSEQVGEVPAQAHGDDMEVDVAENDERGTVGLDTSHVIEDCHQTLDDVAPELESAEMVNPSSSCDRKSPEEGEIQPDDPHETVDDVAPELESAEMANPSSSCDRQSPEEGEIQPDDPHETGDDVAPEVESGEMANPAGTCHNVSPEEGEIHPDAPDVGDDHIETSPHDVLPHVHSAEMTIPVDKVNAEDSIIRPDALHANEDHNNSCGSEGGNSVSAAISQDKTPFVQPASSPDSNHIEPIIPDSGVQDEDINVGNPQPPSDPVCAATSQDKIPFVQPVSSPDSNHIEPIIPGSGVQDEDINVGNPQPPSDPVCAATSQDKIPFVQPVSSLDSNHIEPIIPDSVVQDEDINVGNPQPPSDPVCAATSQDKIPFVQPVSSPDSNHIEPIIPDSVVQDEDINVGNPQSLSVNQVDQMILDDQDIPSVPVCAATSQDKTPAVQQVSFPASDHEIQNDSHQAEQLPDSGVQDEEMNVDNLQPSGAGQLDQIIQDVEPDIPSSTNPTVAEDPVESDIPSSTDTMVAEDPSDTLPQSGPPVPQSEENFEQDHVPASETPHEESQPRVATSVEPTPLMNLLNMFDNRPHQINPRMPQTDPLQAEVERLGAIKDEVIKFHQDMKQQLDTECNKEIEEAVARIKLKYEAKHREADRDINLKKMELDANIKRVNMNMKLAQAFRFKCQDLTPSGHPVLAVSQAGIMQQLHRLSGSPSIRPSSSPGQSSGNQQPPQPPPSLPSQSPQPQLRQPPLQIVHQPAALFSSTPSRTPSTTSSRPPLLVNQMTYSTPPTTSRQLPTRSPPVVTPTYSTPPSTTPTTIRQPPGNTFISSTTPTASGPLPIVDQVTPSITPTTSRPPPGINTNQVSLTTPVTSRPLPAVDQVTPSTTPTASRPPPGININSLSSSHNRRPPSISHIDMSAANLRISTETRGQSPIMRPMISSEPRAPVPNIRPLVRSEPRAPAPHMRPLVNREPRAPAPHLRSQASTDIRARAPHMQPFRSTPSVTPDMTTHRGVLPSQHVTSGLSQSPVMPPLSSSPKPQPPASEPSTVSLTSPSAQTQPSDNLNGPVNNRPRWFNATAPQPNPRSQNDVLEVIDLIPEGTARSSADVVCLSDDD